MFDLSGKTRAGHRRIRRHRRRDRAGAACAGRHVGLSGTRVEPLEKLKAELGERAHVLPADLGDPAAIEALSSRPRRRSAASTSWSTMPASPATTSPCA